MNIDTFKKLTLNYQPLAEALNDLQGKPDTSISEVRVLDFSGSALDPKTELTTIDWSSTKIEFAFSDGGTNRNRRTSNELLDALHKSDHDERWGN